MLTLFLFIKVLSIDPCVYECNPLLILGLIGAGVAAASAVGNYAGGRYAANTALEAQRETNAANAAAVDRTNRANLNLYREQYQDALNLWNMNNEYNSPSNQVDLLREAGLNPSLLYGSSTSASMPSLPTAPSMESEHYESMPYQAYSDLNPMTHVLDALPVISDSLSKMSDFSAKNIDNMTRDEMNKRTLDNIRSDLQTKLSNRDLSDSLRKKYEAELEGVSIMNRLQNAKYDDAVKMSELQTKFQEIQNRVLDESNSRDAARLAIEQYNATSQRKLSNAQINQINVLSKIAMNTDWRANESHQMEMSLKLLDKTLKRIDISEADKNAIFNEIMRNSEIMHTSLKDESIINQICETAFGLGFRDIGSALRNLISK